MLCDWFVVKYSLKTDFDQDKAINFVWKQI